jgi:hypothetical protein
MEVLLRKNIFSLFLVAAVSHGSRLWGSIAPPSSVRDDEIHEARVAAIMLA